MNMQTTESYFAPGGHWPWKLCGRKILLIFQSPMSVCMSVCLSIICCVSCSKLQDTFLLLLALQYYDFCIFAVLRTHVWDGEQFSGPLLANLRRRSLTFFSKLSIPIWEKGHWPLCRKPCSEFFTYFSNLLFGDLCFLLASVIGNQKAEWILFFFL